MYVGECTWYHSDWSPQPSVGLVEDPITLHRVSRKVIRPCSVGKEQTTTTNNDNDKSGTTEQNCNHWKEQDTMDLSFSHPIRSVPYRWLLRVQSVVPNGNSLGVVKFFTSFSCTRRNCDGRCRLALSAGEDFCVKVKRLGRPSFDPSWLDQHCFP